MIRQYLTSIGAIVLSALLWSCSTPIVSNEAMTFDQCSQADYCRISGKLSIREVDHVKMGRLDLEDGTCINVSLPTSEVTRLELIGIELTTIEGRVFPATSGSDFVSLTVNGRRVGITHCGNFYVYVEHSNF